jgi:hypothetical protein
VTVGDARITELSFEEGRGDRPGSE